jgi:hypothetical protein
MQLRVKFKKKIFLSTPSYASLRGVTYICEFLCKFATLYKNAVNLLISDQSGIDWWKNRGSKISWDCLFKSGELNNLLYLLT